MSEKDEIAQKIVNTIASEVSQDIKQATKEDWQQATLAEIRSLGKKLEIADFSHKLSEATTSNEESEKLTEELKRLSDKANNLDIPNDVTKQHLLRGRLMGALELNNESEIQRYTSLLQGEEPPKNESW